MDIKEIRSSGLLEMYVIGTLSPKEKVEVEQYLKRYPELKSDLYEIGSALQQLDRATSISPPEGAKSKILNQLSKVDDSKDLKNTTMNRGAFLSIILGLLGAIIAFLYINSRQNLNTLEQQFEDQRIQCDSISDRNQSIEELLDFLQNPNTQPLVFNATESYPNTNIILHSNIIANQNLLQIQNLPQITDQQSFQLWSLKDGADPLPMNVFQGDEGLLIPIDFESGTESYAITIEPYGGQQSPTLVNLIGIVTLG